MVRLIISYAIPIFVIAAFGSLLKIDGIRVLSGLFVLVLVLAGLATICMMLFPNGKTASEEAESRDKFSAIFNQMVRYPGFVTILMFCSLLFFGIGLFTPIVYPYLISGIGIDSSTISIFQIVMTVTSIGATFYFSRLCDRKGGINALVCVSSVLWTVPVLLLLITYSVYVFILSLGFMMAAFVVALRLKYVMQDAKKDHFLVVAPEI